MTNPDLAVRRQDTSLLPKIKFKPASLQAKILLVVLIVISLYAALISLLLANRLKDKITTATRGSIMNSLRMVEEKVKSELARRIDFTRGIASQIRLIQNKGDAALRDLLANCLAESNMAGDILDKKRVIIQAAYLVTLKGRHRFICAGQDWSAADIRQRPWWRQILRGEEPTEPLGTLGMDASILISSGFVGEVRVTPGPYTMPIYWVDEDMVVGMDYPADLSETSTGPAFPIGKDEFYGTLYDRRGILLATPSKGGHNPEGYRLFSNEAASNPIVAKAIAEGSRVESGSLIYTNRDGQEVLGTYWRGAIGLIYIREKPLSEVYGPIYREVTWVVLLSLAVALAAAVLLTWYLLRDVVHPVRLLSQAMDSLGEGEMSTRIMEQRRDEFGQLFKQFNSTAEQLQNQIRVAYVERLSRRQAELEFLQAQINPHFLYNTLDCIYRLILSGDNKQGGQAIINLSKLFRLSLGRGPSVVTIAEALEQLGHYLELQRLRHGDRITVEIDVAPAILGCRILKLLLQPAVENAFVHGLEPKQGPGRLVITGAREGETIHFTITDDGIGVSEEQLARLREALADPGIQTTHGLANVHRRLVLAYGDGCGVTVVPNAGGGLRVDILWPAAGQEEGDPGV